MILSSRTTSSALVPRAASRTLQASSSVRLIPWCSGVSCGQGNTSAAVRAPTEIMARMLNLIFRAVNDFYSQENVYKYSLYASEQAKCLFCRYGDLTLRRRGQRADSLY